MAMSLLLLPLLLLSFSVSVARGMDEMPAQHHDKDRVYARTHTHLFV